MILHIFIHITYVRVERENYYLRLTSKIRLSGSPFIDGTYSLDMTFQNILRGRIFVVRHNSAVIKFSKEIDICIDNYPAIPLGIALI